MAAGVWAELGIPATGDTAAIRRAYAARLKTVRPDADPAGFARLRDAYEWALDSATQEAERSPLAPKRVARPPPPPASPSRPAPADPVSEALDRGNVVAAAEALIVAQTTDTLTLDQGMRLADRLGWAMAQDRSLSAADVRQAAIALGWPANAEGSAWAGMLRTRLDAERWLDDLRRKAGRGSAWVKSRDATAAHILLGRGRMRGMSAMRGDPALRRSYGEYLLHRPLVSEAFDPVRIEQVGASVGLPDKPRSMLVKLLGIYVLALVGGALMGLLDSDLQGATTSVLFVGCILWMYARAKLRRRHDRKAQR